MKFVVLFFFVVFTSVAVESQKPPSQKISWTDKAVEISATKSEAVGAKLTAVRVGKHTGFDRVVFEFEGESVPKSKVLFAKPPFYFGESDETVKINGKSFLEISFTPAAAHDLETGGVTVKEQIKTDGLNSIKEIRRTYDHEGQVIYVVGLGSQKQFRVQALANPVRLVVDVRR